MITFSVLSDSAVKLSFDGNSHYLQDGEITVPKNSLALVKDESELITFIKAATGDAYLSFHIEDTNFANYTELENWYKANMVSAYGGGGISPEEAAAFVHSAEYNSTAHTIVLKNTDGDILSTIDATDFIKDGMVNNVEIANNNLVITFNTDSGKQPISIPLSSFFDASNYYTKSEIDENEQVLSQAINVLNQNKADISAVTEAEQVIAQSINVLAQSVSGKQDTLVAGSGITISGNVISADGGSSITVDPTLDSGSTNPVANSAITAALDLKCNIGTGADSPMRWINRNNYYCDAAKVEGSTFLLGGWISVNGQSVITDGANEWQYGTHINLDLVETSAITTSLTSSSTDSQVPSAKAVYDALGSGGGVTSGEVQTMINNSVSGKVSDISLTNLNNKCEAIVQTKGSVTNYPICFSRINGESFAVFNQVQVKNFELVETSAITTSLTSSSTDSQVPSAKAVYDALGSLKLVKLTQSEYDALVTKDPDTLYIITNVVNNS